MPFATPKVRRAVEDHHIAHRTVGTLPGTYDLGWQPPAGCNTGCWRLDHGTGRHIISIHREAFSVIADKGVTRGAVELYKLIYEHEAAHSLYTTQDLKKLSDELKAQKIPWRLQNLFEDVRIEHMWWAKQRKRKHFRWRRWIKLPAIPQDLSPTQLLFHLKCEAIGYRIPKAAQPLQTNIQFRKVLTYYNRIRQVTWGHDTFALIPILLDWLKDFPETGDDTIQDEGGLGTGDLGNAMAEAGATPENINGNGNGNGGSKAGQNAPVHDPSHGVGTAGPSSVPASSAIPDEPQRGKRLARLLSSAFRSGTEGKLATSNPSKKLNVRGLLRGNWSRPFIGRARADERKPHVSLIFDLSGSMGSQLAYTDRAQTNVCRAADAGRVLVRCLSDLAHQGHITGRVYASGLGGVQRAWNLPIRDPNAYLLLIGEQGDDGIPEALSPTPAAGSRSVFNEITSKSKLAIVYTDGEFGSKVDKTPLHARGLYTLGLCCTARDKTASLKAQFDHVISRESLDSLADALVRFLRSARF